MPKRELQRLFMIIYDGDLDYNEELDVDIKVPADLFITKLTYYFSIDEAFTGNSVWSSVITKAMEDTIQMHDPIDQWVTMSSTNDRVSLQYFNDDLLEYFPTPATIDHEVLYEVNTHFPIISGTTLRARGRFQALSGNNSAGKVNLIIEAEVKLYPYDIGGA